MEEIWKNIVELDGLYQISNFGRVRSLDKVVTLIKKNGKHTEHIHKGKILSPSTSSNGYKVLSTKLYGENKAFSIHRLVAKYFLCNENNYPIVNHIDGNKENNNVSNLEWCTQAHNVNESYRLGLQKRQYSKNNFHSKPINQYDINGNFLKRWNCSMDIQRKLGFDHSAILACCKHKANYNKSHGYIWKYANK